MASTSTNDLEHHNSLRTTPSPLPSSSSSTSPQFMMDFRRQSLSSPLVNPGQPDDPWSLLKGFRDGVLVALTLMARLRREYYLILEVLVSHVLLAWERHQVPLYYDSEREFELELEDQGHHHEEGSESSNSRNSRIRSHVNSHNNDVDQSTPTLLRGNPTSTNVINIEVDYV